MVGLSIYSGGTANPYSIQCEVIVALLFLAAGALFGLLYILIGVVRAIRGSERIGFLDTLMVFLTTLVLLAALISNRMEEQPLPMVEGAVLGIAGVVLILSVI